MASIRREVLIAARPEEVWDAIRDVGAIHTRLAPGFVVDTRLEEGARLVTFGNGLVARELIVDVDDKARRLAWAVVGGRLRHHNASLQVFADDAGGSQVIWIADLLPDELVGQVAGLIEQGMAVMKKTLEARVGQS
jgi:carbon monoxide dehydrogenase subunit G